MRDNHIFELKWYDLNRAGQRKLLQCIFGSETIAEVELDSEIDDDVDILECDLDDIDEEDK